MSPDEYCQQKTVQSGSSFYYSFLFLPPERRRAITALYAFCREVDDTVDECTDESIARIKLAWWRNEVAAMYAATPTHPVMLALQPHLRVYNLQEQHLQAIIDGMEMDLNQTRYLDYKAMQTYCWHVASVVGILSASIFGVTDPNTLAYAEKLGLHSSSPISSATSAKMRARAGSICPSANCSNSASPRRTCSMRAIPTNSKR